MTEQRPKIGFIGVGNMGAPMAACMAAAGYEVGVTDQDRARCQALIDSHGIAFFETPRALAKTSDVLITMLPNSDIVRQVLLGPDGALQGLRAGAVVLEMSSGVPTVTREIAAEVETKGCKLVDAPVSGGVARAKTGDLAIMVGGDETTVALIDPLLRTMGSTILKTGGVGSAHAMKALNNLVSAAGLLVSVEALLVGQKFGLDASVMVDVLNASTGMNNSTQKKLKQFVLSRKFNSGFGMDLMVKDLSIALDLARDSSAAVPFAALCRELWAGAAAKERGQDHTSIALFAEQLAGAQLGLAPNDTPGERGRHDA